MPTEVTVPSDLDEIKAQLAAHDATLAQHTTALADHETRIAALEAAAVPEPPEPTKRDAMGYYHPSYLFDTSKQRNFPVGHCWYDQWGYLDAIRAKGMKADYELACTNTSTAISVRDKMKRAVDRGYSDVIRNVMVIDEPDLQPYTNFNFAEFRKMYEEIKKLGSWPVYILCRCHSSSMANALPWIDGRNGLLMDVLGWDPYVSQYPDWGCQYIASEARVIRQHWQAPKPLQCVVQCGAIGWACPPGVSPHAPSAAGVEKMGVTALDNGATIVGTWWEGDWPPNTNALDEPYVNLKRATDAWDLWSPKAAPQRALLIDKQVTPLPLHTRPKPFKPKREWGFDRQHDD